MNDGNFWRGKVVIITGASSGVGEQFAQHVAARGARVGLLARNEARLSALKAKLSTPCEYAVADVTDAGGLNVAVATLESSLGPCDVFLANAGVHRITDGRELNMELARQANELVAVNVCGVINSFAAVLPGMVQRRGGRLCAVASVAGLIGLPAGGPYSASKAAVLKLCEGLRVDLRPLGIYVTAIGPGLIDTPMLRQYGDPPKRMQAMLPADAARRIAWAIERGRAEHFFPNRAWLRAIIVNKLPVSWYAAMWTWLVRKKKQLRERGE